MSAKFMTVKDLAARWAMSSPSTIYHLIATGQLPALHIEGAKRISIAAVEAFEAANTTGDDLLKKSPIKRL